MNSSPGFYLKIAGPGLVYEREVSASEAAQIMTSLLGTASTPTAPKGLLTTPSVSAPKSTAATLPTPQTARGYLNTYRPKRVPDKIACLALYLREIEQRREFSRDDLKRTFQAAAEPIPANLGGRDLQWARQVDWVAPSGTNKDLFYLTHTGEQAVRSEFSDEVMAKSRLPVAARRKNEIEPRENDHKSKSGASQ